MATPDTTLLSRAELTSIVIPASGRKAVIIDGETLEIGNTGWRDLSGSLDPKVAGGRVLVRREGNTITWAIIGLILAADASVTAQNLFSSTTNMDPFFPDFHHYGAIRASTTVEARLAILTAGSPRLDYSATGAAFHATVSFPVRGTGAWPGTLPGVADGQPVGV